MASDLRLPRVNAVTISGRITRDVELRYTANGTPVAGMSLAFSRYYRDQSGEGHEESYFIDVVAWSKLAEKCAEELHKGSPILVEGRLQTRNWVDKSNQNRKTTEIVATNIHFLEWSDRSGGGTTAPVNRDDQMPPSDVTDDDVPF